MAPATTDEPSAAARGRLESLSQVAGVLGTQWGDEGKGKLVDILAQRFDVVARCQVSLARARLSRRRNARSPPRCYCSLACWCSMNCIALGYKLVSGFMYASEEFITLI